MNWSVHFPSKTEGTGWHRELKSVGVEIEGLIGNIDPLTEALRDMLPSEEPGSVYEMEGQYGRLGIHEDGSIRRFGELSVEPIEITYWSTEPTEVWAFVDWLWRECEFHTNESCGTHVHVKPNGDPYVLATPYYIHSFLKAYRQRFSGNQRYLDRLKCQWCEPRYPRRYWSSFWRNGSVDRYQAVNPMSLEKVGEGTIEHRILPHMENPAEFQDSVGWLADTSGAIIAKMKAIKAPLKVADLDASFGTLRHRPASLDLTDLVERGKGWADKLEVL